MNIEQRAGVREYSARCTNCDWSEKGRLSHALAEAHALDNPGHYVLKTDVCTSSFMVLREPTEVLADLEARSGERESEANV